MSNEQVGERAKPCSFVPAPVYALKATYVQATCACGWAEDDKAHLSSREAKGAWGRHHIGGGTHDGA